MKASKPPAARGNAAAPMMEDAGAGAGAGAGAIAERVPPLVRPLVPAGISDKEISDFVEVIGRLAFFDSIHDFWRERKTVSAVSPEDDEDGVVDMPEDRLNTVRDNLVGVISAYTQVAGDINGILNATTANAITSVSDIEDRVIKYLSANYSPFNGQLARITFDEILSDEYKFRSGQWNEYSAKMMGLPDNLQIVGNGRSIKSLTTEDQGAIAFFILAYMNPNIQPGAQFSDVEFTFDMAPRDIGKLFMRLNQVYNAIYPQNIADSAPTSFSALQGRNRFYKADGTVGGDVKGADHIVRSNLFSLNENYEIRFVDNNFGSGNKFGFSIVIKHKDKFGVEREYTIPFGNGTEQGPPVNYLMDIIATGEIAGIQPKLGTAAKLPSTLPKPYSKNLLFDLKRMGDHEQMRVDRPYGVTGDRLAFVYRRLLRKPAIYHSHTEIRLSRVLGGEIDKIDIAFRNEKFKCREIIEKLNIMIPLLTGNLETVTKELTAMKTHVDTAILRGTVFKDEININLEDFATMYTEISATFATYFVRLRMMDISNHIGKLLQTINGFTTEESVNTDPNASYFKYGLSVMQTIETLTKENVTDTNEVVYKNIEGKDVNITGIRLNLENNLNNLETLRKMNIIFDTVGKREPYYVELFDPVTYRLKKGVRSDVYNFSSGPYLHGDTGMQVAIARLLVAKRARRPDAVTKIINENLSLYLRARDDAKEAFFDKGVLARIEEATDISNGLTPARILGNEVVADDKNILTAITKLATLYNDLKPKPAAPQGGVKEKQLSLKEAALKRRLPEQKERRQEKIDAQREARLEEAGEKRRKQDEERQKVLDDDYDRRFPPVLQYRDIHDLFMEICIDSETTTSVDDLEMKWTLGINDIREQSEDEYGRVFRESFATDIVTYFLGWRNNSGESIPIFKLDGQPDPVYGELSRKETGNLGILNYIGAAMLSTPQREQTILSVLQAFSLKLKSNPRLFEAHGTDGLPTQWSGIPTQLQVFVTRKTAHVMGGGDLGGRRPLYSNVQVPDTPRSESIEHPRLQQRSRTRRTTGVRRSTRKSKTR